MTLTQEQISEIRNFISKKGIKYLDVQMEIIDHTASAIEERMDADNNLTFEQALKQTHASFGIFGFSGLEDAIINGMGRKYKKIFWNYFISFFGWKYISLVLLGVYVCYQIQVLINDQNQLLAFFTIASLTLVGILIVLRFRNKVYKNLMVYHTSLSYFIFVGMFVQVFNLLINKVTDVEIMGISRNYAIASLIFVLYVIYLFSASRTGLKGLKESKELLDKYNVFLN